MNDGSQEVHGQEVDPKGGEEVHGQEVDAKGSEEVFGQEVDPEGDEEVLSQAEEVASFEVARTGRGGREPPFLGVCVRFGRESVAVLVLCSGLAAAPHFNDPHGTG